MRLAVSRTTPGVIVVWRGMFAVWPPHGHPHLVCGPRSEITWQSLALSALTTSRSFISLAMTITLDPLDSNYQEGIDS